MTADKATLGNIAGVLAQSVALGCADPKFATSSPA